MSPARCWINGSDNMYKRVVHVQVTETPEELKIESPQYTTKRQEKKSSNEDVSIKNHHQYEFRHGTAQRLLCLNEKRFAPEYHFMKVVKRETLPIR